MKLGAGAVFRVENNIRELHKFFFGILTINSCNFFAQLRNFKVYNSTFPKHKRCK